MVDPKDWREVLRDSNAINDTSLTPDEVEVEITYGSIVLPVQRRHLDKARELIAAVPQHQLKRLHSKLTTSIDKALSEFNAGRFTKQRSDNLMKDLALLHALKQRLG
jgi:hypothetical protein